MAHYRICVNTRGAKHFNDAPTTMPFTHHNTGIRQWERNESILTSNFGVKQLREKIKNKINRIGGAHWRTEACKLFRSSSPRFKFSSTSNYVNA